MNNNEFLSNEFFLKMSNDNDNELFFFRWVISNNNNFLKVIFPNPNFTCEIHRNKKYAVICRF